MNIFNKVAWQSLKGNRTRTFVTIIGVALSATMISAVATFGTSLLDFIVRSAISKSGDWHIAFEDVDSSFIQNRADDKEVTNTTFFENLGYAQPEGLKSPEKPYFFIAGFYDETLDALPVSLISGRLPENDSEVLIPSHIAIKGGITFQPGDTLTLALGKREAGSEILTQHDSYRSGEETLVPASMKAYTVVGTYERPGFEEHSAPGYTVITKADPAAPTDCYSLFVTLKNPRNVRAYADSITGTDDYVLNEEVLRFLGVSDNNLFNTLIYSVGGILIAIIMIGSVFLIYNSFNISLNERIHQFGILMSVGATRKQLRNSVLFEGLCISVIGIPIGVLAGIGSIILILPVVISNFSIIFSSSVPLTLSISAPALIAAAIVSLITVMISAYIPAKKAADMPVMECIRQTNEIKTEARSIKTSRFTQQIYGLEGTLALKNFKRNKKRYRSVVLSLSLSVILFVTGSAFGTTLKGLAKELTVEIDGDISFYTQNITENELFRLYDKIKAATGVYKITYQANTSYSCSITGLPDDFLTAYREAMNDGSTGSTLELPLLVQFMEDDLYYDFIESLGLPVSEYTGSDAKILGIAMNTVEHTTFFKGSNMDVTLSSISGNQTRNIGITFEDNYPLDFLPSTTIQDTFIFLAVVPYQLKPTFDSLNSPDIPDLWGLTIWSEVPAQSMTQIQSIITEEGVAPGYSLSNLSASVNLFRSLNFVIDVFTYVFVAMISLIGIANVFNTISTNIRLRRRELAMLRSVGMSNRNFYKMMNFECAFYGLRTLLFSLPIAVFLSWTIYESLMLAERMDDFKFVLPWKSMTISILGVFLIVFITMLYATSKIRKENIIDALRDDMT